MSRGGLKLMKETSGEVHSGTQKIVRLMTLGLTLEEIYENWGNNDNLLKYNILFYSTNNEKGNAQTGLHLFHGVAGVH